MDDPRFAELFEHLRAYEALAVAFSGGADSTLLLAAARDALCAERIIALTAVTPYMVRQEIGDAIGVASQLGVRHELVEMEMPEGLDTNPPDRCYRCKRAMYGLLLDYASERGFQTLLDASNIDDVDDSRPGLRAVHELGVRTPFIACRIDKQAVRSMSEQLSLPTSRKPSNVCLLTRLRFDQRVSMECLQQIEEAERLLAARGYEWVRVRCHDHDLARIEVSREQRRQLIEEADVVSAGIRQLGFRFVALDLDGYQHGSMCEDGD
jgi:uncharacterized protein